MHTLSERPSSASPGDTTYIYVQSFNKVADFGTSSRAAERRRLCGSLLPTHARASEPRPEPRARGRTWDEIPRSPMKEPELVCAGQGYPGDLLAMSWAPW